MRFLSLSIAITLISLARTGAKAEDWVIDTQEDWTAASQHQQNITLENGMATPAAKTATFQSKLKRFDRKRQAKSIRFEQSPVWQNWEPIPNVGPSNLGDAPVLLCIEPHNYWMFGRYGGARKRKNFQAQPAKLEGFDVPLVTTPFPNQYDAPGGLKPGKGG
jgi:hypothetical protein